MAPHSLPEVFILESLTKEDEKGRHREGEALADMLRLAGKDPKYFYFQSKRELTYLLPLFKASRYRYLHLSCHGTDSGIQTTTDDISSTELAKLLAGYLKLKRLFLSACSIGNQTFVRAVASRNKGMHSILAPAEDIYFDHAAAFWNAFYVSMFTAKETAMKRADIASRVQALVSLLPVDMYFASYRPKEDDWHYETLHKILL